MAHHTTSDKPAPNAQHRSGVGPGPNWIIDRVHRVLYCPVPKAACSTVKYWLVHAIEGSPYTGPHGRIHAYCRTHYAVRTLPPDQARSLASSCLSLTILRDPVARLVSAFVSKLVDPDPSGLHLPAKALIEQAHRLDHGEPVCDRTIPVFAGSRVQPMPASSAIDYARGLSFAQLVSLIERTADDQLDRHVRPQHTFTRSYPFDIIGTPQTLSGTLDRVASRSGITVPTPPTVRPRSVKVADRQDPATDLADMPSIQLTRLGIIPTVDSLVTDGLRRRIERRYARDLQLLAQAKPSPPLTHQATI